MQDPAKTHGLVVERCEARHPEYVPVVHTVSLTSRLPAHAVHPGLEFRAK